MGRFEFFGEGLPDIDRAELKGKLIVLEGTDGVRRSTHISLLKQWLENHGHAVLDTGMTHSALAGKRLKQAKEGHTLGGITMSLFYATDFADRLENEIIPALRAGFNRSLHLFINGACHRAGGGSGMVARGLRFRAAPGCDFLFACPDRRPGHARAAEHGIRLLGIRHGYAHGRGHV